MPRFTTLDDWLAWQETLHPASIDLGLERVGRVAERLQCRVPAKTVISVAGTNGKGSSVAMLEAILSIEGYRVGCYTSPHLFRYNERLRIQDEEISDSALCDAFDRVDRARGDDSLTYFEFGTLAALDIMTRESLDVAVLEVGLGGRLDAVNIVDADAVLITSIGIDHTDWLGADRESIGREKAGIMRHGCPAVCGDPDPPRSVVAEAERIGVQWRALGVDFRLSGAGQGWHWEGPRNHYKDLPWPALPGGHQVANAASVLMLLEMLRDRVPVTRKSIESGLRWVQLPGRIQRVPGKVEQVLDVSHNAQAALALVDALRHLPPARETHVVLGMMQDKDVEAFVKALAISDFHWYPVSLAVDRACTAEQLAERLAPIVGHERITAFESMPDAVKGMKRTVKPRDRILVCGSFFTVAEWAAQNADFN